MKVGSILKVLEKYSILKKGVDDQEETDFRGRGLTLQAPRQSHVSLSIEWDHQKLLEEESYFKLEQIKKLLFYPSCRKRFILEYFGDDEDLQTLPENCGMCDFCLDKNKYASGDMVDLVPLSVFAIVLELLSKYDSRYGSTVIAKALSGSKDQKLSGWRLDESPQYGALQDYSMDLINGILESLLMAGYTEKSQGQYPLLGLTRKGKQAIRSEDLLKE